MHDGKIYKFRLSTLDKESIDYQKHVNFNNKLNFNHLKSTKWLEIQYQLCIKLSNDISNNPIKLKSIQSIISYIDSWNKSIIETKKYLSNTKKSLKSVFLNSVFNYFNFTDLNGYLSYYRKSIQINQDYIQTIENNNLLIINKYYPSFSVINDKMYNAQRMWHDDISKGFFNTEKVILLDPGFITFLPLEWIQTFKITNFIGKNTKDQGSKNGPDSIFVDADGKTVGIEIFTNAHDNLHIDIRNVKRDQDKLIKSFFKTSTKYGNFFTQNFVEFTTLIKNVIQSKLEKHYVKTDRLYLVIALMSTQVINPFRQLCTIVVNNNHIFRKKFNKIVII